MAPPRYCNASSMLVFAATVLAVAGVLRAQPSYLQTRPQEVLRPVGYEFNFEFERSTAAAIARAQPYVLEEGMRLGNVGVTSHHLPTAALFIAQLYATFKASGQEPDTFVVIGPDHFERCGATVTTGEVPYVTPFGTVEVDARATGVLVQHGVARDNTCFDREHAVGVQATYIARLFPDARIVPLAFSSRAGDAEVKRVVQALGELEHIAVIGSIDFSHYHPYKRARELDRVTAGLITRQQEDGLTLENADSPASMRAVAQYAASYGLRPLVVDVKNSFDYTGDTNNTTGYLNVVYTQSAP